MIGIEGQYVLQISIGGHTDCIAPEDLILFKLIEEAGNLLPMFEIIFNTNTKEMLEYMNEGQSFDISIGQTKDLLRDMTVCIVTANTERTGNESFLIHLTGFLNKMPYLTNRKVSSKKGKSTEVLSKILSDNGFNPDIQSETDDDMFWLQNTITDRDFITKIWLHSNVNDTIPLVAVLSSGDFIFTDLKKITGNQVKWRFLNDAKNEETDVVYMSHSESAPSGYMNQFGGYGKKVKIRNSTTGEISDEKYEPMSPILSMSESNSRNSTIEPKVQQIVEISENVHPKYWESYYKNIIGLTTLSSYQITISIMGLFKEFRLLDYCFFKDDVPVEGSSNALEATEQASGMYIITKICNVIRNNNFLTYLTLSRESMNQMKGNQLG